MSIRRREWVGIVTALVILASGSAWVTLWVHGRAGHTVPEVTRSPVTTPPACPTGGG